MRRLTGIATAVVFALIAVIAVGQDGEKPGKAESDDTNKPATAKADAENAKGSWTSFRNGPLQRGIAKTTLPAKPELLWDKKSKDGWVSTVAIADGRVYAPALEGYVYCLDLKTGKEIWKYRSIESKDEDEFAAGFKAAPLVTADTIYVGDEDGFVHAIDRKTGKKRWVFETLGEIAGGATLTGENILVPSHDANLYCLTPEGKVAWKFETLDRVNCAPALVENSTFVAGCDQHLRVIDVEKQEQTLDVELGSYLIASPAIYNDVLYVGAHSGEVIALNWKTGKDVWRYRGDRDLEIHASAAVTDDLVLVGSHDKLLHAIDRKTGQGKWTFKTRGRISSSPAVVGDRVFFGSDDGSIYGVSLGNKKTKAGTQVFKHTTGKDVIAGPAIGEGCLVVGSADRNGRLYCFGKK